LIVHEQHALDLILQNLRHRRDLLCGSDGRLFFVAGPRTEVKPVSRHAAGYIACGRGLDSPTFPPEPPEEQFTLRAASYLH
jgi:hypothetical protein